MDFPLVQVALNSKGKITNEMMAYINSGYKFFRS